MAGAWQALPEPCSSLHHGLQCKALHENPDLGTRERTRTGMGDKARADNLPDQRTEVGGYRVHLVLQVAEQLQPACKKQSINSLTPATSLHSSVASCSLLRSLKQKKLDHRFFELASNMTCSAILLVAP